VAEKSGKAARIPLLQYFISLHMLTTLSIRSFVKWHLSLKNVLQPGELNTLVQKIKTRK
jgi:hypothetical protein